MKIALCNEVVRELDFAAQCAFAAELGYDGIELAPFTLGHEPQLISAGERAQLRRAASDAGIAIVSLHWLLVTPAGLSINAPDPALRRRTVEVIERLIGLAADLGAGTLVHGSPAQRDVAADDDPAEAWQRARDTFAAIAPAAEAAGVDYCLEPLAPRETNFVNTLAQAVDMVEAVGNPAFCTMIDTCAAGLAEAEPLPQVFDTWLPTGQVRHVQVNDSNKRGPGQGPQLFAPVMAALKRHDYQGSIAVEPFDYVPDGPASAARAIGYLRGIEEALAWQR
ncbi:MAG TPA: sugar phosphate isomerase/epimerase family protein [Alphaproteobacteria bacterium]|jgi:sugar phosphate isomerase/epimerase|nr:sugar phosphate isomerase/epimerase family protein [Alphaproteobacteria bacterium]MDP6268781.1 sugar phosphate isomerase/epimerase family protein [Alphaproteobacteria bacterium]MDP7428954.1 sugar phosphate isomerase/epimerase family protein [Alphaproteobacteria bacterium]HJM51539.1 sugar phosphate isomerase/epimerase family protein [Alphaproteobacteria bacterium]